MALVKLVRAVPEVAGGKTACEIPEEAVEAAIRDGWSLEKKSDSPKEDKEEELKATSATTGEVKKEIKEEKKEEPKASVKETKAKKNLRDE